MSKPVIKSELEEEIVNILVSASTQLNIRLNELQKHNLIQYILLLQKWNKVYNLTSITDTKQILIKHIIDCLASIPSIINNIKIDDLDKLNVVDIGSGAGLPSIILAIIYPNWHITSIDSVHKKIAFQQQVKIELKLTNLNPVHIRIQDFNHYDNSHIDLITARAYASTHDILEQTQHLITKNKTTMYAVFKGKDKDDIENANNINIFKYKFKFKSVKIDTPFLNADRSIIFIRQI